MNKTTLFIFAAAVIFFTGASTLADVGNIGLWGDQGDGTYVNPILPGDYSDIDVIQVDSTYYMMSSTFQFCPGVIILQSKDMVNWTIIGHAVDPITQMGSAFNYAAANGRGGRGIWAGSIRYHQNKFWIYYCTPDEGMFMTTAPRITGPWAALTRVSFDTGANLTVGWDDCCPFWDNDGQGYMVMTNFSDSYKIHLFKMNDTGTRLISSSDAVIHQSSGSEANKLYKINGYYYHFYSESGHPDRVPMMERSTNIYGPYTGNKILMHDPTFAAREPNQGGFVQDRSGEWWFIYLCRAGTHCSRCERD